MSGAGPHLGQQTGPAGPPAVSVLAQQALQIVIRMIFVFLTDFVINSHTLPASTLRLSLKRIYNLTNSSYWKVEPLPVSGLDGREQPGNQHGTYAMN